MDPAALPDQVEPFQVSCGNKDPRTKGKEVNRPVGLGKHGINNGEFSRPYLQTIADRRTQAVKKRLRDNN